MATKRETIIGAELTQGVLKTLISYDPATGALSWRMSRPGVPVGKKLGWLYKNGYLYAQVCGKRFLVHRLCFLYMMGSWPKEDIDHIDGDRTNNIWSNLREATRAQNLANRSANLNRDLPKNVYKQKNGKFRVHLKKDGIRQHVGYFTTLEEASRAAIKKQQEMFGEYARQVQ